MKLRSQVHRLESNVGETTNFKIKQSAKMFRLLSDQTYSDKIAAVLREVGCNAADAHKEADNSDPFTVKLPSMLEPWLKITDYGTGLSPEDVIDLYTTYGESTKEDSNLFVGALGLGSKSPFAYTQQFTVESRWNGDKHMFSSFINEKGEPCITSLGSEKTNENNGLTISIPVKEKDIGTFHSTAKKIYRWFKPIPNVIGFDDDDYKNMKIKFMAGIEGSWGIREIPEGSSYSRYNNSTGTYAIMGNVSYRVSGESVYKDEEENNYRLKRMLDNSSLTLFFEIGELDVAISREELSYDNETISKIKSKINLIKKDAKGLLLKEIKKAPNLFSASVIYSKILDKFDSSFKEIMGIEDSYSYKGKTVDRFIQVDVPKETELFVLSTYRFSSGYKNLQMNKDKVKLKVETTDSAAFYFHIETYKRHNKPQVIILIEDTQYRVPSRILNYMRDNYNDHGCIVIKNIFNMSVIIKELDKLGVTFPRIKMSDIPDVSVTVQSGSTRSAVAKVVYTTNDSRRYRWGDAKPRDCWKEATVDIDTEKGIYVDLRNWENTKGSMDDMYTKIRFLFSLGLQDKDTFKLYGCPGTYKNKMKDHKNWQHLDDYLVKHLKRLNKRLSTNYKTYEKYDNLFCHMDTQLRDIISLDIIPNKGYYKLYKDLYNEYINKITKDKNYDLYKAVKEYEVSFCSREDTSYKNKLEQELTRYYPMFSAVLDTSKYEIKDSRSDLETYINLVDDYERSTSNVSKT